MRKAINVRRAQGTRNEIFIDWKKTKQDLKSLGNFLEQEAISYIEYKKRKKPGKRKYFSKKTKDSILYYQNHRCNNCKSFSENLHFHHKDGNRSNNDISNAEALCPNCHAKKTRKKKLI